MNTMTWIRADSIVHLPKGTRADVWIENGELSYRIADCVWSDWCSTSLGELCWITTGDRGGGRKVEDRNKKVTHVLFVSSPTGKGTV